MIRSILLPLAEGHAGASATSYGLWLAQRERCSIHGLAMVNIKAFEIPVLGTPDGFMPSLMTPPVEESRSLMQEMTARAKECVEVFARACASRGISCSTGLETGFPEEIVTRAAIAHDLVLMARGGYTRAPSETKIDLLVSTVLRACVRPVFVSGQSFREPRHILVAYDGSLHSARALVVAAQLAAHAEMRCTLMNVASTEETGMETLAPAEAYLAAHGVNAKKHVVVGHRASDMICGLMNSTGAEILIMGAFGHSPIREMIFGSTTEQVLSHCGSTVILQY